MVNILTLVNISLFVGFFILVLFFVMYYKEDTVFSLIGYFVSSLCMSALAIAQIILDSNLAENYFFFPCMYTLNLLAAIKSMREKFGKKKTDIDKNTEDK